jgi:hypothetical protein
MAAGRSLRFIHQPRSSSPEELERFPAKWIPVRAKKTRQNKKESLRSDSIGTEKALELRLADRRWLKCDPCEVVSSPNQTACERGAETVERKIKLSWQKRKAIEP